MTPDLWTPDRGLPDGARADAWLREQQRRERDRWRHVRDPRVEHTIQCAVTFRSKSEVVGNGTSPTPTEPSGAASGDALAAFYLTTNTGAPTFPAGWTSVYNGSSTTSAWRVGYIIRGGSAPSYAFTHTGNIYREIHVACLQGAAAITFDASSTTGSVVTSTTALPDPTAVSPVAATSMSICGGFNFGFGGSQTWVAPAGYAIRTLNTGGIDAVMATKSLASNASEDPAIFTSSGIVGAADNLWNGFVMTFTDAAGGGATTWGPWMVDGLRWNRLVQ